MTVDRRPHPTFDRVSTRWVLAGAAVAVGLPWATLGLLPPLVGAGWAGCATAAVFVAGLGLILAAPVNRYPCPTCGAVLVRGAYTREFACGACDVSWTTRGAGYNVRESFQRTPP